jgi:hypothetical protein
MEVVAVTLRAIIADDDAPKVRRSARVCTVAGMLDEEPSQIRRMLSRGDLEGHRTGKRGVRIYLDSVIEWQRRNPVGGQTSPKKGETAGQSTSPATKAAHRHAVADLRRAGIV